MNICVVSPSVILRKGLSSVLSNDNMYVLNEIESLNDLYIHEELHLIVVELNNENSHEISNIKRIKSINENINILVLDFYNNKDLFIKTMEVGISGYVLCKSNCEDILYAIKQISRGKKYYDGDLMESLISKTEDKDKNIEVLTRREKEILKAIGNGMSNRDIANSFCITEHTVKKHISSIFSKLNFRDRMQAAIYVHNNGLFNTQKGA